MRGRARRAGDLAVRLQPARVEDRVLIAVARIGRDEQRLARGLPRRLMARDPIRGAARRAAEQPVPRMQLDRGKVRLRAREPVDFVELRVVENLRHDAVAEPAQRALAVRQAEQHAVERVDARHAHLLAVPPQLRREADRRTARADARDEVERRAHFVEQPLGERAVCVGIAGVVVLLHPERVRVRAEQLRDAREPQALVCAERIGLLDDVDLGAEVVQHAAQLRSDRRIADDPQLEPLLAAYDGEAEREIAARRFDDERIPIDPAVAQRLLDDVLGRNDLHHFERDRVKIRRELHDARLGHRTGDGRPDFPVRCGVVCHELTW